MADQLTGSLELKRIVGGAAAAGAIPKKAIAVNLDPSRLFYQAIQDVGLAAEAIAVGDVTDDAIAIIENLDTVAGDGAVLSIGYDNGGFVSFVDVPVGGLPAILPTVAALANVQLKSDTASTQVLVSLYKTG